MNSTHLTEYDRKAIIRRLNRIATELTFRRLA
jgi:hypothetical protein